MLTSSTDGTARAFEMERGSCLRVLAGHTAPIHGLAMDPWARFVVTASADGTARVWDLSSARSIHVLKSGCTPEQGERGVFVVSGWVVCGRVGRLDGWAEQDWWVGSMLRCNNCIRVPLSYLWLEHQAPYPLMHPALPCRAAGGVLCVALSPCTRFAILGCANGSARMYDVISGGCGALSSPLLAVRHTAVGGHSLPLGGGGYERGGEAGGSCCAAFSGAFSGAAAVQQAVPHSPLDRLASRLARRPICLLQASAWESWRRMRAGSTWFASCREERKR